MDRFCFHSGPNRPHKPKAKDPTSLAPTANRGDSRKHGFVRSSYVYVYIYMHVPG